MDSFCNKTFACPNLPHDERWERAFSDLVDLCIDLLHLRRFTDDIIRLETRLELHRHTFVFGLEDFVFFSGLAAEFHSSRKHLRDDFEQMNLVVEVCFIRIMFVSTQGANDFLFHDNRDA